MIKIVENMKALATKWHEGQFRKGAGKVPYIEHPAAVVKQLREWGVGDDEFGCIAKAIGWGHDLIEETKVTRDQIVAAGGEFGERIYDGIKALSLDVPNFPDNAPWDGHKAAYIAKIAEKLQFLKKIYL